MASGSKRVIYAALIGNGLIAIAKFFAAFMTGSSAMLSEGIHSTVDCGNQILLLFGMKRAKQAPDDQHPFGYGMELYFWAFVVAIMVFAVGSGISIYEGVLHVLHPEPLTSPIWNYGVLSIAMVFEAGAWWVAFREFEKTRRGRSFLRAVRESKDPTVFTVLFEDSAAMLGLIIAFIGVAGAQYLNLPILDGVASIAIGCVLAIVATLLAIETKGLLIGESAEPRVVDGIRAYLTPDKRVLAVNEILTMHMGPNEILLNVSLDFIDGISAEEIEAAISDFESHIKGEFPRIGKVFIEAQSILGHMRNRDRGEGAH